MEHKTYSDAVAYIENIPLFGSTADGRNKSGNDNLSAVLKRLGHPENACKTVHIAGTNGKGSTAVMMADLLTLRGMKVGLFTSPHLVKVNERIAIQYLTSKDRIHRNTISDTEFVDVFREVKTAMLSHVDAGGMALSYFEFLFAMATVYFAKEKPDYVVYETGLGGRLDATNLLQPKLGVITSIGLDHTQYLGDTIEKVAFEKAGIIKVNTPVLFLTGSDIADAVIIKQAKKQEAEAINVANSEYIINEFTDKTIDFSMCTRYYRYDNIKLPTCASYQVDNARLAIAACNKLLTDDGKAVLTSTEVCECMKQFFWAGRMEEIRPNVFFDGAHNPAAIDRFIETVHTRSQGRPIHLLFAVAGDKDYTEMVAKLSSSLPLSVVYVTSIANGRRVNAKMIAQLFYDTLYEQGKDVGCTEAGLICKHLPKIMIYHTDDIRHAYLQSLQLIEQDKGLLFCVGSLYLVGSLKQIDAEDMK